MSRAVPSPGQVWEYINGLERLGWKLGLERVAKLAEALGNPQNAYRTIHVVGTNGKSSTTRFISSLLQARGLNVGAYVSPHLISLAERQMVNSVCCSDEQFCEVVGRVMEAAEQVEKTLAEGEHLTQFEVLTVAAFLFFREQGCEVAVVEAGLGGRLDATAIISSDVQVVTSIGLEHMDLLGDTLEAILEEKAAVIQQGGKVISGPLDIAVKGRLRQICSDRAATCSFVGDEIVILADPKAETFDVFGLYGSYMDLRLSVLGTYQRANAAAAIGAAEAFVGRELDEDQVRQALLVTEVPGRLEVISQQPLCIFDGSHNAPGMEETVRCLDQLLERRRLIAVVSVLKDKESTKMLETLASRCDIMFVTQSSSPRAIDANELAESMSSWEGGPEIFVDPDPRSAIMSAYRLATSNQVVLVTGSLTLIADLKRELT